MASAPSNSRKCVAGDLDSAWLAYHRSFVFARFGHVLLMIALVCASGGHWAVLQSIAWSSMLAGNLRSGSLAVAVEHTFDGDHPCPLCRKISEGRKSHKSPEFVTPLAKFEFPEPCSCAVGTPVWHLLRQDARRLPASDRIAALWTRATPAPPPRGTFPRLFV